jgi:hypothetical protein
MAMKKRKKGIDKAKEARRRARKSAAPAGATRVIVDKRLRTPKHKKKELETETY